VIISSGIMYLSHLNIDSNMFNSIHMVCSSIVPETGYILTLIGLVSENPRIIHQVPHHTLHPSLTVLFCSLIISIQKKSFELYKFTNI
jgi:hypothetical protein